MQRGLQLSTGEISAAVHKGRHTTRYAQLLTLDGGGYVVDTPGLREFGLWAIEADAVETCFPEFAVHLGDCRYSDCDHLSSEGCAVRRAVEQGSISERRYGSYVRLREDAEADQAPRHS